MRWLDESETQSQAKYSSSLYETHLANMSISEVVLNDSNPFYKDVYSEVQIINNSGQVLLDTSNGKHIGNTLNTEDVQNAIKGKTGSYIYRNDVSKDNELAVSIPLNNGSEQVGVARFIISMNKIETRSVSR